MPSPSIINARNLGDRVFQVFTNAQLTMSNIVITGGAVAVVNSVNTDGGGIYNAGTLILVNCVISNNTCGPGIGSALAGGGIFNIGQCTITNCMIVSNSFGSVEGGAGGNGAGLYNGGNASLVDCHGEQ